MSLNEFLAVAAVVSILELKTQCKEQNLTVEKISKKRKITAKCNEKFKKVIDKVRKNQTVKIVRLEVLRI